LHNELNKSNLNLDLMLSIENEAWTLGKNDILTFFSTGFNYIFLKSKQV